MTDALTVKGIIPGDLYGANVPSTSSLQRKIAEKVELWRDRRQEYAQAKQIIKDEQIYNKIRSRLIEKVFDYSPKEIERFAKNLEKFQEDSGEVITDKDKLSDIVNIANGARGTERGASRTFGLLCFSTLAGAGLTVTVGKTINEAMTAAAMAIFTGLSAGAALVLVTALQAVSKLAYNWYYKHKAASGNRSDTKEKERAAIEEITKLFNKIESFAQEIAKDEKMLVEKRKSMSKKEFDAYLDEYLQTKLDFIKELGVNDYLRKLGIEIEAEVESKAKDEEKIEEKPLETEQPKKEESQEQVEGMGASL